MGGINGLLNLARDGLAAQSLALNVTGQNIANVNTPGYSRREAVLETRAAGLATYGGVNATGIRRSYDQFIESRTLEANGQASSAKAKDDTLASVEALFNDTQGTGLGSTLQEVFSSFGSLAADPADQSSRAAVLNSADKFAQWMQDSSSSLSHLRSSMYNQAQEVTGQINDTAQQIAALNDKISLAEGLGGDASDLKDQREKLVTDLSEKVNVRTFTDGGGKLVVTAAGSTLVEGSTAASLSMTLDANGAMQLVSQRNNTPGVVLTGQLTGGVLAGIRESRDVDLMDVGTKLDQLAFDVATAINTQHQSGYGLDGSTGRPLFSVGAQAAGAASTISLDSALVGHPERLAASSSANGLPGGADNAVALGQLGQANLANGGTRTAAEAYSDIVAAVGQKKATFSQSSDMRDAMKQQLISMQQSVVGVSMDEEMISLSRYQRGYEAASKLLQTADQLLAELMQKL